MAPDIFLSIANLDKKYPGTHALKNVSLDIPAGRIVGLVGENGAGKSTLLKLIMGVEQPTGGSMAARGHPYAPRSTRDANRLGVGMVFQEQSLIPNLTVGQNIYLGNEKPFSFLRFVNWRKMYRTVADYLTSLGITNVQADRKVGEYMFSVRQMVEIARVLNTVQRSNHEKTLILLDEPTSVLNDGEIRQLFDYMRSLRDNGHAVVFVSHRLDEILEICDSVVVFKDGEKVGELDKAEANEAILYKMMVGDASSGEYYQTDRQREVSGGIALELEGVGLKGACKNVDLQLYRGEILGICGVTGSGKEDVCAILCGDSEHTSGRFSVDGREVRFRQPSEALRHGILSIPKERREEAMCESLSVEENICLSNFSGVKRAGVVSGGERRRIAREYIKKLNIKCGGERDAVANLSGGNAQKVVFARALFSGARILILNHPTRGVDVGAKSEIYTIIRDIVAQGLSIVLLGDTLEESIGLSDRLLVMKDGLVTKTFAAPANAKPTQLDIVQYMM